MQKLSVELKNAPRNTSQVPCSVSGVLNREETLSVPCKVLADNGSDENLRQHTGGLKAYVYVLNSDNSPLMPCTPAKARHLLVSGRAEVVQRSPFTIRLLWKCETNTQQITLGIDLGYRTTGFSAVSKKRELISGELKPRTDVSKKIQTRAMYRRTRRSRLWHRKSRFDNRVSTKKEGWLAPSIRHRMQTHIRLVEILKKILPISKVVVEVANFDQQKMQNPEISGIDYQQGELQGYEIREYLLDKWGRKCAYCKKNNLPLQIEHIIPKIRGGTDRVSNLTLACDRCNKKKDKQTAEEFGFPKIHAQAKKPMKAQAFMNNIRWRFVTEIRRLVPCTHTYGFVTKYKRSKTDLEKSHINDAFVIADGETHPRSQNIKAKQVRRQNRSLYKANLLKGGIKKRNTVREVRDFKRFDKVLFNKEVCFIYGLRTRGFFDIRTIDNEKIGCGANYKKLTLIEHARGIVQEVTVPIPPTTEAMGTLGTI